MEGIEVKPPVKLKISLIGFLLATLFHTPVFAAERILAFDSQITVHEDATMTVRETLLVHSEGDAIRHGIFRDFPTTYKDPLGNRYVVDFSVREVLRDGQPDDYHFSDLLNGKRVYIGQKDSLLPPGDYTYTLTYTTNRQLGFFKDHDELYWNVTGNGWAFPIDQAWATITLPKIVSREDLRLDGYTGRQGSKGKGFRTSVDMDGTVHFSTTGLLQPKEGLTVVVGWPKGIVRGPTQAQQAEYLLRDNLSLIIGGLGLLIVLGYYLIVWAMVGRDPAKGSIMPLYEPPDGLSPATVRYIAKMGFDHKTFAAALIQMAVKRFLSIRDRDGTYTLTKDQAGADLAPEEKEIAKTLLDPRKMIELKQENHTRISAAIEAVKRSLRAGAEKKYFVTNWRYFAVGLALSAVIAFSLAAGIINKGDIAVFMSLWLSVWTIGVTLLLKQAALAWQGAIAQHGLRALMKGGRALLLTLFSIPFLFGEIFGCTVLFASLGFYTSIVLVGLAFINVLFYHLLKARTPVGRALMDKIEGFKMFLSAVEKERMNVLYPASKTPELFEKYLPYALALDVEQAWAKQFSDLLSRAEAGGSAYQPVWYTGSSWDSFNAGGFASGLGSSLASAVASSSTAPGSSSGGGGGGSSGGGGGGGGGGGW